MPGVAPVRKKALVTADLRAMVAAMSPSKPVLPRRALVCRQRESRLSWSEEDASWFDPRRRLAVTCAKKRLREVEGTPSRLRRTAM